MKASSILKSALTLLVFSASVISSNAQQNKDVSITNFNEISVSSGIDLYLTQSNSENIRINAHPDLIKNVIIEKEGNNLRIKYKDGVNWGRLFKNQSIKVYINYKTLKGLSASGGSDVYTQNTLKTDRLSLSVSGGSDLKLDVVAKDMDIQASGGSDVDLKGSATNMQVSTSGGSDVNALDFVVDYAKVSSSGGSDANIHVNKALEASASGGSDINYKGSASVKNNSSKSGDVNRLK
nr:head GIN domain-containing protein [uncultured Pedobacter sp.]